MRRSATIWEAIDHRGPIVDDLVELPGQQHVGTAVRLAQIEGPHRRFDVVHADHREPGWRDWRCVSNGEGAGQCVAPLHGLELGGHVVEPTGCQQWGGVVRRGELVVLAPAADAAGPLDVGHSAPSNPGEERFPSQEVDHPCESRRRALGLVGELSHTETGDGSR